MTTARWRSLLPFVVLAGALGAAAPPARVATVTVALLDTATGDTLSSVTPAFLVRVENVSADDLPLSITLEAAPTPAFSASYGDTTVVTDTTAVELRLARPLPAEQTIYWRARVLTARGTEVHSPTGGPRIVPPWLRLVFPSDPNGTTIASPQPTFVWSSAQVSQPPGPWRYTLRIRNVATGREITIAWLSDTSYTPPFELESNTSYRWAVEAFLPQDTARAASIGSFVIVDPDAPTLTLLYQNFPNPFPSAARMTTCIWFDLDRLSLVQLGIYDLRGNLVRQLIPNGERTAIHLPGRYGRGPGGADASCDETLTWDGTAADGRIVPPGVYLVRLRTSEAVSVKKILFQGR